MENLPQSPSQRTATGNPFRRPVTSSTLSGNSQSDLPLDLSSPNRRRSVVPARTPSTSSQSGTQHEWDYNARSTTASTDEYQEEVVPIDFWPHSDSEDDGTGDETPGASSSLKRSTTTKSSSTGRMFRAILQKFGRSYNNRYDFLPNDAQERDRNTLQHHIALEVLDGRLHLAPITHPRRVLDLGCGPGDWALTFARRNPKTAVFGMDVEPVKPRVRLPNCRFHLGDFTEKWPIDGKFNFIYL
ncbi:S-adenosyl-L-methionine-dependent methyltransferase [Xylariaceae sp. FL1272]|nr:S-adenosyl-L-methionine-dependent methyltransferase [Xylariaceae sp. FL1272]